MTHIPTLEEARASDDKVNRAKARTHRPLYQIAVEIGRDWENPDFGAVPYLEAMRCLHNTDDTYGADTAESVVLYFLANAGTWRGETARRIKAELKSALALRR